MDGPKYQFSSHSKTFLMKTMISCRWMYKTIILIPCKSCFFCKNSISNTTYNNVFTDVYKQEHFQWKAMIPNFLKKLTNHFATTWRPNTKHIQTISDAKRDIEKHIFSCWTKSAAALGTSQSQFFCQTTVTASMFSSKF